MIDPKALDAAKEAGLRAKIDGMPVTDWFTVDESDARDLGVLKEGEHFHGISDVRHMQYEWVYEKIIGPIVADAITAYLAALPAAEPVAWVFELAAAREYRNGLDKAPTGWTDWKAQRVSLARPYVPDGAIRNLSPLYRALD